MASAQESALQPVILFGDTVLQHTLGLLACNEEHRSRRSSGECWRRWRRRPCEEAMRWVFERKPRTPQSRWLRQEGKLVLRGAVPLSMDLTSVSRELRYRYRLVQRPQGFG